MDQTKEQAYTLISLLSRFKRTNFNAKDHSPLKGAERFVLILIAKLSKDQPVTNTQIAEHLNVTLAAVTHHVNSLEQDGLVERSFSNDDRRVTLIKLTAKGKRAIQEFKKDHWKKTQELVDHLGAEDTQKLIYLLEKIFTYINTKRKEERC